MGEIVRNLPLYHQVKQSIMARIEAGEFEATGRLPSEADLVKLFGVSRMTVRDALLSLEKDGLIIRRHGIGTFLAHHAVTMKARMDDLPTIPQVIRDNGLEPSMNHLEVRVQGDLHHINSLLGLPAGAPLCVVERLYLASGKPAILCLDYLPMDKGGSEVSPDRFDGEMLTFLDRTLGLRIDHVLANVKAVQAGHKMGRKLQVPASTPLLLFEQVAYTVAGEPVLFTQSYHLSDMVTFTLVRKRR